MEGLYSPELLRNFDAVRALASRRPGLLFRWTAEVRWRLQQHLCESPVSAPVLDFKMLLDTQTPGISKALFSYGIRERDHTLLLLDNLKPNFRCLDLGANIGYYTILMAEGVGAQGRVFAVEPDARNLPLLRANIALNGHSEQVQVFDCAISNTNGRVAIDTSGATNLTRLVQDGDFGDGSQMADVPSQSLDSLGAKIGPVDLIRMDIEGAEAQVLGRSGLSYLSSLKTGTTIFVEVHPTSYPTYASDFGAALRELYSCGYRQMSVVSSGKGPSRAFFDRGYVRKKCFHDLGFLRCLFEGVTLEDAVYLTTIRPKVARYLILTKI